MAIAADIVTVLYILSLVVVTVYCIMLGHLLYKYLRHNTPDETNLLKNISKNYEWPFVTIQLPVYNEFYVVEGLIDSIVQQDYPKDRFEIQVLDDSTDETVEVIAKKVKQYQDAGFSIFQIRRPDRKGFKAGALAHGMKEAKGEFIGIFDADFLPKPDFLKALLPYFEDEKVALVQARWDHLNEEYSLITRLQALQLNAHFQVEQHGRVTGNYFLQFNGTAGIWRKKAIIDAGSWQSDTLTEDLDLSIRAQLNGWKLVYLKNVGAPAELPMEMNGLKSQQFRWMKGGAETSKKLLSRIWSSNLNWKLKFHATAQVAAGSIFLFTFLLGILSVPASLTNKFQDFGALPLEWGLLSLIIILAVQYVSNVMAYPEKGNLLKRHINFLWLFPVFLSMSMGLSLHNSLAVIEGWMGKKSSFVRTPKFNLSSLHDRFKLKKYSNPKVSMSTWIEGLCALYFIIAIVWEWSLGNYGFLMLHLLFATGFAAVFILTIKHSIEER
jgi:cellulose synthase/poly-beta-1,6-N-acetylglucosamine synthase-like glycosyltransferase